MLKAVARPVSHIALTVKMLPKRGVQFLLAEASDQNNTEIQQLVDKMLLDLVPTLIGESHDEIRSNHQAIQIR